MAGPFIFIGTHKLKDGTFESFQADSQALAEVVESNEPGMIAQRIRERGWHEVNVVQGLHPDAESDDAAPAGGAAAHHRGVCQLA